ncbi:glycoside hydrolase family 13 protein [Paucibacter sp. DJ2R-2]|uniref:glycoside hydrolase family 13 protein n=1 Tax=Paucibacter sp. DJ2R-2 TaxID=2893558 RepID=UPI0021E3C7CA|nr:glycoside hydrolase family 13 protein [Paucibacter sp. DJ2R-2]MCV2420886.1 glycoside hydrolase family 13 protein [Paucibacter sp. DJ4R-1]MCV2440085.1 glycoside hydrolase family 13 protein [Paucibacter sp. DJ2R-2]
MRGALMLLAALLALPLIHSPAQASPSCTPSPLGTRELFLRGSFNNWSASDAHRLVYVCDRYELYLKLQGEQSFKIADEDWSADADFGGQARQLQLKGPSLNQRFKGGMHKLVLRLTDKSASLAIQPFAGKPPQLRSAPSVTDPVALSLRFDSRDLQHKAPFGAVTPGTPLRLSLNALPGVQRASLVVAKRRLEGNQEVLEYSEVQRLPLQKDGGTEAGRERWSCTVMLAEPAIYGYHFEVEIAGKRYVFHNNRDPVFWTREKGSMGAGSVDPLPENPRQIRRYRQTVYATDFKVPDWARDIVYYSIFPERFRNGDRSNDPQPGREHYQNQGVERHSRWLERPYKPGSGDGSDGVYNNDFFGGDLAGIIEKLDYIRELGANTIYMTPVFRAASNHKYDTGDYKQIDPAFGSNDDFKRLTLEAAKRGIRVIPDTSLNHVGSDSPYFNRFNNFKPGGAFDGGRLNPDSIYASWFKLDPSQAKPEDQYQGWTGVKDLPELDKNSPAFRDFAYRAPDSVTRQWLDFGAAGWRMDVAPWVPDDFWREWRQVVKATRPDALTVAETWFDASKYFLGDMFDSTMNYIFRNAVLEYAAGGDARKLYAQIELMREAYPPQAFYALMNLLSSHDQARALHHFGYSDEPGASAQQRSAQALSLAKQRLRLAVFFQMVFPGAPTIYYGDEVGLGGGDDPYNRAPYPWADEGGRPDQALLADFKRLTALRHAEPVLRHGSLSAPLHLDANIIVLARQDGETWALTAMNNAAQSRRVRVNLPSALVTQLQRALSGQAALREALAPLQTAKGSQPGYRLNGSVLELSLPARSGRVLISQPPSSSAAAPSH